MKIGRNEICPCGSGKKYKRCCANKKTEKAASQATAATGEKTEQPRVTLGGAIAEFQEHAKQKREVLKQLGVFLLFSDCNGDSWVLEVTDSDCIQIAAQGEPIDVPLEETDETIVIDWSHTFGFKNKQLILRAYRSKETLSLDSAPSQQLYAASRKILKRISPEVLEQVHVDE